jgi:iron-sulfur cluster repair protein YtfE (RIC family)
LRKKIEEERLKRYVLFFYKEDLVPHFSVEEKEIFPHLGSDHPLVVRALKEHQLIRMLCNQKEMTCSTIRSLESTLNDHIRFEERILFKALQELDATAGFLETLKLHDHKIPEQEYADPFWK